MRTADRIDRHPRERRTAPSSVVVTSTSSQAPGGEHSARVVPPVIPMANDAQLRVGLL
jgi:hypothetical protein